MRRRSIDASIAVVLLLLACTACSKEKLTQLVDKTKEKVTSGADQLKQGVQAATDTAKEQLNLAGKAQLQLDASVETSGCYATFLTLGDKRPNVLQVRSYSAVEQESFPSMLLRASVGSSGKTELIGQTVSAQLYVQKAADAPVYFSNPGTPIQLKIVALDDKSLTAEIVSGNMLNTQQAGELAVTGTLSAVWQ